MQEKLCGIAGIVNFSQADIEPSAVHRMAAALQHRGPDDEGYLFTNSRTGERCLAGGDDTPRQVYESRFDYSPSRRVNEVSIDGIDVSLANRRLAILDLSSAGHQPMCNKDKSLWIVHNGEIYNYREIRSELKRLGYSFTSKTDTEVIINAYEEWGPDCLQRFNGMWAFVIWDSARRTLFCSVDRFGIKPFYYYWDGKVFAFASEIKALLASGLVKVSPNDTMIYDYLTYGQTEHTDQTFFAGVKRLPGGHWLELRLEAEAPTIHRFYDIPLHKKVSALSGDERAQEFFDLFEDAVRLRLISDVPVGSCLSGGLDSSSIVCMIDRLRKQGQMEPTDGIRRKAFSARYADPRHDEGRYIQAVVDETSVDAYETYPTAQKLRRDLEKLVWHQEEPFGSTSIYAQWSVFDKVRQAGVPVVLDGQGADEILAGYFHYQGAHLASLFRSWHLLTVLREAQHYHRYRGDPWWKIIGRTAIGSLPPALVARVNTARLSRGVPWLSRAYANEHSDWSRYDSTVVKTNVFDHALYRSVYQALPSLLRYEDRNSMAHSVESRLPFLDYRLVEWVFSTPIEAKISGSTTKAVLRSATKGLLPEAVRTRRDKIGFSTPLDVWLRTELRDYVVEMVNSDTFQARQYFDHDNLKRTLQVHLDGSKDMSQVIWRWINLELWHRAFVP